MCINVYGSDCRYKKVFVDTYKYGSHYLLTVWLRSNYIGTIRGFCLTCNIYLLHTFEFRVSFYIVFSFNFVQDIDIKTSNLIT